MERKIETEVLSFDREQKMMKTINDLKSRFKEYDKIASVLERAGQLSREIDELKAKEKEQKKEIRKLARQSQRDHEAMMELSAQVDALRVKEKEAFERFVQKKKEYNDLSRKNKDIAGELEPLKEGVQHVKEKRKRQKEEKEKKTLEDKKTLVQDKIRRGEKLTTEDFLVFQR